MKSYLRHLGCLFTTLKSYHPFVPVFTLGPRLLICSWLYHSHESFLFFRETTLACNTWFFFFCLMTERLSKSTCLKSLAWSLRRRMRGRGIFPWWSLMSPSSLWKRKADVLRWEYLQEALMDLLGAWALPPPPACFCASLGLFPGVGAWVSAEMWSD